MLMAEGQGPVLWIGAGTSLHAPGLAELADPGRLIVVAHPKADGLLWAAEEALRSGMAPLVLVDLRDPPALTPVRRLHLAAETGGEAARSAGLLPPLAVLLTPGTGGAQGVESRWQFCAAPSTSTLLDHRAAWRLDRLRARMEPPAAWEVREGDAGVLTGRRAGGDPLA